MNFGRIFEDRIDAGRQLAARLATRVHEQDLLVLGLPRGGVPVAFEVARALRAELDVFLVRKLGLPGQKELAVGAIASGGVRILNETLLRQLRLSSRLIEQIAAREEQELKRREELYREGRPAVAIQGRTVIIVDDGLATGSSMKAAVRAVRLQNPKRVVVAVPVAAQETCDEIRTDVDDILCAYTPQPFVAVGLCYKDFSQTTDQEVQRLLENSARKTN